MSYTDYDDFESIENKGMSFDFRGYLFKALHYWKLIFLCIGVAFLVAYLINIRKQSIYRLHSLISIESEQNPLDPPGGVIDPSLTRRLAALRPIAILYAFC